MQTEKKIDLIKEMLLWIYIALIVAGFLYSSYKEEPTATFSETICTPHY